MGYFSNGTEGEMFEDAWCSRCVHSDIDRPGKEYGDKDNPPCPVWMAHLLWSYELCNSKDAGKEILDMLIRPVTKKASDGYDYMANECQMFQARDAGCEIEGQTSLEVEA